MARRSAVLICLLVLTAGCASFGDLGASTESPGDPGTSSESPAPSPTTASPATATSAVTPIDLPAGIDSDDVEAMGSLDPEAREAFRAARGSSEWVTVESGTASRLDATEYVYADGRLWEVTTHEGTEQIALHRTNDSDAGTVIPYDALSSGERELFDEALESGPFAVGPDDPETGLPDYVEYDDQVYLVETGTVSWGRLGVDVDPYRSEDPRE